MQEAPFSKKILLFFLALSFFFSIPIIIKTFEKGTTLTFCKTGKQHAVLIQLYTGFTILVNASRDKKILDCLATYMPFFDRTIDLAILTSPNIDNFGGFITVLDHYKIKNFLLSPVDSSSSTFKAFKQKLIEKKILVTVIKDQYLFRKETSYLVVFPPPDKMIHQLLYMQKNDNKNPITLGSSSNSSQNYALTILFSENNFNAIILDNPNVNYIARLLKQYLKKIKLASISIKGFEVSLNNLFLQLAEPHPILINADNSVIGNNVENKDIDYYKGPKIKKIRTDEKGNISIGI